MRAVEFDRYGPAEVLTVRDVPDPVPGPGEVRVRVAAASVNPKDTFVRKGRFRRFTGNRFPQRIGCDFAGTVDALGGGVRGLAPGQPVWGMVNGWHTRACAGAVVLPADAVGPSPPGLDPVAAAAVPLAALTALQALRDLGRLSTDPAANGGRRVLVNGASGGVGCFAVQIAKALGTHVTAVAGPSSQEFLRTLGADAVVDYTALPPNLVPGPFDVWFDVFGNQTLARVRGTLAPRGTYATTVLKPVHLWDSVTTGWFGGRRGRLVVVRSNRADLDVLAGLVATGRLRPVIDRVYALDAIADAHRHVESKHTRGKVVVRVAG